MLRRGLQNVTRSLLHGMLPTQLAPSRAAAAASPLPPCAPLRRGGRAPLATRAAAGKKKTAAATEETDVTLDPRAAALKKTMAEINATFGKGSIMRLGDGPKDMFKVETFSSGSLTLDIALGGGLPKGRIIEIYGPESSGKTTLAMQAMTAMQKAGGNVALIDVEHAFDPEYAAKMGMDVGSVTFMQPDSGEQALETVDMLVRSSAVDLIVVDSVASLMPSAEKEGEIGMSQVGLQARLMSQALRKLSTNASKGKCAIIFINQLRSKIGVIYGSPEVTSGGNALKFYASVRMDIRKIAQIPEAKTAEEHIGIRSRVKVVKNKVAAPFKHAEFDIFFGSGINHLGCVVDAAEEEGVIVKRGAWYSYQDGNLGQGREKTVAALGEDPELAAEIEAAVRALVAAKKPAEASGGQAEEEEEEEEVEMNFEEEVPLPVR